jgi:hypothetical protein
MKEVRIMKEDFPCCERWQFHVGNTNNMKEDLPCKDTDTGRELNQHIHLMMMMMMMMMMIFLKNRRANAADSGDED